MYCTFEIQAETINCEICNEKIDKTNSSKGDYISRRIKGMSLSLVMRLHACLFLMITTVRAQVPGPNAVVLINGQTMINCLTRDLSLSNWRHTSDGTSDVVVIATGCNPVTGNNAAYYRTELQKGDVCGLIIANATMHQAGVYSCYDGATAVYQSLVTVIDPAASIIVYNRSEVVEGDMLNISCSINYNGAASPAPSLRPLPHWTTSPEQIFTSTVYHPSTNVVTLVATVTVQKPTVPVFHCRTVFEIIGNTNGYDPSPPADNLTVGNTAELDVQYVPSIPDIKTTYQILQIHGIACEVGILTCNSSGNPQPTYEWFDTNGNIKISNGKTFDLAEVNRNYTCLVKNTIRNVAYQELSFHVQTSQTNVQDCDFPRNESTSIIATGCEDTSSCVCSHGAGGLALICNAVTYPNALYMWKEIDGDVVQSSINVDISSNGTYYCAVYFDRLLSNYTGNGIFPNGSSEKIVTECSISIPASPTPTMESTTSRTSPETSSTLITHLTSTTTPACNDTDCPDAKETGTGIEVGLIIWIVIGVFVIANVVATGLFFWYYKRVDVSLSGKKERNNKLRLDRRFTWLKKMMPCVSDTKESTGSNCLWVSLFLLLGIVTGIVTFPIWIIIANKYEKNNETSALNKREENGEGIGSGENGRRPTNSSANHSQPPPTNQMNANHREGPYQNESSKESIEMNNSLRSRTQLLQDSPPSRPPPAGRPPPPPNKPSMNQSTNRSKDYTVNDQQTQAANPEHTTYADLHFVPRNTLPTAIPVQFLNVSNDTYASLNKT